MLDLVGINDFENHANQVLPKHIKDYYRNGAGRQLTLKQNTKAFSRYKLRPRCLRNVEDRDLSTTIMGERISMPIGISPTALQKMAHPEGECASVQAAQAIGTIYTLSTLANCSIEEVAKVAPLAIKWFQVHIFRNRDITKQLVQRAERAGFKVLVVSVDTPVSGIRLEDMKNKFSPPSHLSLANFSGNSSADMRSGLKSYMNSEFDASQEWKEVQWLKMITKLPIVLKGILTAEDALLGVEAGAAAIWVSNHGARQVDGTPATVEALPEILKAVGNRVEVYIDGGIRDGTDVLKALGLGAKMVFVGRPAIWGLVQSGEEGVKKVLNILKSELDTAMALTGCAKISDIKPEMVVHESFYSKM